MRSGPLVLIGVLSSALLIGGCARKSNQDPMAAASTTVTSSPAPTTVVDPTGPAPSTAPGGNTPAPQQPTYPSSAKAYTQELLKAWGNKNTGRIDQLAIQSAVQQIKDSGSSHNSNWRTFVSCNSAGSDRTLCIFRNEHGDQVEVKLNNLQLGHPTAVLEAMLHKTTYPTAPNDYVNAFIYAWRDGNIDRMKRLSNDTVAAHFKGKTPPSATMIGATDMGSYYRVDVGEPPAGNLFSVKVTKSSLGKAYAITAVV